MPRPRKPASPFRSALPTTRAGNSQVPADEDAPKVRFSPRLAPQPFYSGTPSDRPTDLQRTTLGSACRVEQPCGLRLRAHCASYDCWRQVAVRLTAPPHSPANWSPHNLSTQDPKVSGRYPRSNRSILARISSDYETKSGVLTASLQHAANGSGFPVKQGITGK